MSDYQKDQQSMQDQPTQVAPVVEDSSRPHRRRSTRYEEPVAEAPVQEAPAQEAPAAPAEEHSFTPPVRVNSRPAPVAPVGAPRGVPRPASLNRQSAPAFQQPSAQQPAGVRRPVSAPGYAQRPAVNSSYARPVHQPSGEVPRVKPNFEPQTDRFEKFEAEEEQPRRRKGRGILVALVVLVLILALAVLGVMMIPEGTDGVLGQVKSVATETFSCAPRRLP